MSLSDILGYVGMALVLMAFVFLMIGILRARPLSALRSGGSEVPSGEIPRLEAIRRADWRSAGSLFCGALVAFALTLLGRGPFFMDRSGNVAGGVILIAGIVGVILAIVVIIRYVVLSRALRALHDRGRD